MFMFPEPDEPPLRERIPRHAKSLRPKRRRKARGGSTLENYYRYEKPGDTPPAVPPVHVKPAELRRRQRMSRVYSDLTDAEWKRLLKLYKFKCAYCGAGGKLTRDHIVPVCRGGPDTYDNVVPACIDCNHAKGERPVGDAFPGWKKRH